MVAMTDSEWLLVYAVLVALALFVVGMMSIVYKLVRALKEEEEEVEQQTIPKPADQVIAHTRPNAEVIKCVSLGLPNKKKEQTVISLDFVFFSVGDDEKIN